MGRSIICLEGIECSGKTTLLKALRASAARRGTPVPTVSEFPSESSLAAPIARALQSSIFIAQHFPGGPAAALEHMWQAELEKTRSRPGGRVVLQDRGIPSVIIYQAYFISGARLDVVGQVEEREAAMRALGEELPSWYIVLDIPCSVLADRFEQRNARPASREECGALRGIMELYRRLAASGPRCVIVEADVPREVLVENVEFELRTRGVEI